MMFPDIYECDLEWLICIAVPANHYDLLTSREGEDAEGWK